MGQLTWHGTGRGDRSGKNRLGGDGSDRPGWVWWGQGRVEDRTGWVWIGRAWIGRAGTGPVGDGLVGDGPVAKKVEVDFPSFNWF
jgi:hypothetical protein